MYMKRLRGALNDRENNVDIKVHEAVDNKWKEQSATYGVDVLKGEIIVEQRKDD